MVIAYGQHRGSASSRASANAAPISGFTSHLDYIDKNIDKLLDMPVWAFHGKMDTVVPFEETERIVKTAPVSDASRAQADEEPVGACHRQPRCGILTYMASIAGGP